MALDAAELMSAIKKSWFWVNPEAVLRDVRAAGLMVGSIQDIRCCADRYWRLERLADRYVLKASELCILVGLTAGIGGTATAVTLGIVDLGNVAARLFQLCQKLAIINGFDPRDPLQQDRLVSVYLAGLGFDAGAQALIKQQLSRAASVAGKRGAYSNYILKLIVEVAKRLGTKITSKAAAEALPIVGGVIGGTVDYLFAKGVGRKMQAAYKDEFFDTWQAGQGPAKAL